MKNSINSVSFLSFCLIGIFSIIFIHFIVADIDRVRYAQKVPTVSTWVFSVLMLALTAICIALISRFFWRESNGFIGRTFRALLQSIVLIIFVFIGIYLMTAVWSHVSSGGFVPAMRARIMAFALCGLSLIVWLPVQIAVWVFYRRVKRI